MTWLGRWAGDSFGVWFGAMSTPAPEPELLLHAGASAIAYDEEDELRTLFTMFLQVTNAIR